MDQQWLARRSARAHGVLLPEVLDAAGISMKQRRARVQSGEWRLLPCGIAVVGGAPVTFEMSATAALAAVRGSVLCCQSAGTVHGVDVHDDLIHVGLPPGTTSRRRGVVVHRFRFDKSDITRRSGFPVTTIERTLVDLSPVLAPRDLRRAVEIALVERRTTFTRVEDAYLRVGRQGRPGTVRMRDTLARLDGCPPSESELEAMMLDLLASAGLATPVLQHSFEWNSLEKGRVDMWFPADELIVELDGRRFHSRLAAFERDRRRDQLALVKGLRTVRFPHRQITDSPAEVVDVLRALTPRSNCVLDVP